MSARPKTVAEEIFEGRREIEKLLYTSYDLDEMAIARLKGKIQRNLKVPGQAPIYVAALHHELGYLLALQNKKGADEQLDLAERFGMDPIGVALSRSHIAIMSGRIADSRLIVESLLEADVPVQARRLLSAHLGQVGMLEAMVKNDTAGERDVKYEKVASSILRSLEVDDLELTKRLDTACRVIRAHTHHPILGIKLFAMEGEGILYRYVVKVNPDDLLMINDRIIDALLDEHEGPLDQELSVCVTPWSPDADITREAQYHVSLT